jgi:hypothetical protein
VDPETLEMLEKTAGHDHKRVGLVHKVAARYLSGVELPDHKEGFAYILVQTSAHEWANGQAGTVLTWQANFPVTTECVKCGGPARVALGLKETGGNSICHIHQNTRRPDAEGKGGFWPHDVIAACLYFCQDIDCATVTTLWNQG